MTDTLTNEQKDILQLEYVLSNIFSNALAADKKEWTKDLPTTAFINEHGEREHKPIPLNNGGQMLNNYIEGRDSLNEDNTKEVLGKYIRDKVEELHESRERKEMIFKQMLENDLKACKKKSKGYNQIVFQPSDEYVILVRKILASVIMASELGATEVRQKLAEQILNPKKTKESL